ncbi:hypothetical protein BBJ28_00021146 [Nothophytophthora sp. Chile5]|nr:hypothetical protein BBJ28_00021146 [Nothophytophthora sp. Chile5]
MDAAFLEEVACFLDSFDVPAFPAAFLDAGDGLLPIEKPSGGSEAVVATALASDGTVPSDQKKAKPKRRKATRDVTPSAREIQKAKDRKRRNEHRERQKLERESLQRQVGELSTELDQIQKTKENEEKDADALTPPIIAWKAITKRQLEVRLASETQQRKLKSAVRARAALIEGLSGLVRKRLSGGDLVENLGLDESSFGQKRVRLEPADTAIFEAYLQGLNTTYAQTEEVFRVCGMNAMPDDAINTKQTWKPDGQMGCFQYVSKQMMSFNFNETCQSLWQVVHRLQHRQNDRELYDGVTDPDSTVASKFRIVRRQTSGRIVSVVQRVVARRFEETNRMVTIWRSFTEGEGEFTGMHSDETGWCVVKSSAISLVESTVLETCIRHVPMHFRSTATLESAVEQFTDVVLCTGAEDAEEITDKLEKLLLDNDK